MLHLATITFRDAGLFQRPRKRGAEQIMLTPAGPVNREDDKAYIDAPATTIPAAMVANMYRVLLGVRPVPTFRGATQPHKDASSCDLAVDLAKRCRVAVETPFNIAKDGTAYLIRELQMTTKAWVSENKPKFTWAGPHPLVGRVSWRSVELELGPAAFAAFTAAVAEMLGSDAIHQDMVTVFGRLYMCDDKQHLLNFFGKYSVPKKYKDTLLHGKTDGQYYGQPALGDGQDMMKAWTFDLVNRGVNEVSRRNGTIQVLIDDETKARLQSGPGMATLLDGGVAELAITTNVPDTTLIPGEPTYEET